VSSSAGEGLKATTSGSNYNTVLAVFKDDGAGLIEVACNDDEVPGGKTSAAAWQGDGGDYLIVVGAFPGHPGNVLQLQVVPD
jgi:hypothetical protein